MIRRTILLAEDNQNDAELSMMALSEHMPGSNIVLVSDGEEVIDYLRCRGRYEERPAGNPSVILLDLKMPKMDGLEVLGEIKADPELCLIPVVMVTSSREEKDLLRSYRLGVNAYIVKPVEYQKYSEAMKQVGDFWVKLNEIPFRQN